MAAPGAAAAAVKGRADTQGVAAVVEKTRDPEPTAVQRATDSAAAAAADRQLARRGLVAVAVGEPAAATPQAHSST